VNVLDEVRRFKDFLGTNPKVETITLATVLNYLTSRANCASTFNTYRKHLTTFFNFLVAHEWIAKNPTKLIPLKKETFDVKVLRPEMVERLLCATYTVLNEPASSCMRAYLALATFMGIRPEEVLKLDWKDINLEPGHVYISKLVSKTGAAQIFFCKSGW
jgi:site-specific recombinase XerD